MIAFATFSIPAFIFGAIVALACALGAAIERILSSEIMGTSGISSIEISSIRNVGIFSKYACTKTDESWPVTKLDWRNCSIKVSFLIY